MARPRQFAASIGSISPYAESEPLPYKQWFAALVVVV